MWAGWPEEQTGTAVSGAVAESVHQWWERQWQQQREAALPRRKLLRRASLVLVVWFGPDRHLLQERDELANGQCQAACCIACAVKNDAMRVDVVSDCACACQGCACNCACTRTCDCNFADVLAELNGTGCGRAGGRDQLHVSAQLARWLTGCAGRRRDAGAWSRAQPLQTQGVQVCIDIPSKTGGGAL